MSKIWSQSKFRAVSSLNAFSILAPTVQGLTSAVVYSCALRSTWFSLSFQMATRHVLLWVVLYVFLLSFQMAPRHVLLRVVLYVFLVSFQKAPRHVLLRVVLYVFILSFQKAPRYVHLRVVFYIFLYLFRRHLDMYIWGWCSTFFSIFSDGTQTCTFEDGAPCFLVEATNDDFDWTSRTVSQSKKNVFM